MALISGVAIILHYYCRFNFSVLYIVVF